MTVKEMIIYVDVALEELENKAEKLTKETIIKQLIYLAYNCNKKEIMRKKDYVEEKYF